MTSAVANRYAKALLAITKQQGVHAKALDQLKGVLQVLNKDSQAREYFLNPSIAGEQKAKVLQTALAGQGLIPEVENCVILMAERGRLSVFSEFVQAFQSGIDEENGITRGIVRAAKPLTAEAQTDLENKITQILKKKIVLTFKEDPSLLGGVIAQVGGWTFDDSLEMHLKRMNEELNRRAY